MRAIVGKVQISAEIPFGGSRKNLRAIDAVTAVARAKWAKEQKPAANLAVRADCSTRMCEYWLEKKFSISGDALANLLRSDIGFEILERIAGEAEWFRKFKRAKEIGETRRLAAQLSRRVAQLEMEV